ncbi:MAG: zinc metalloprotease HtpX [Pseudomonadota bacterium]
MDSSQSERYRAENRSQARLLIGGMAVLVGISGWVFAGVLGLAFAAVAIVATVTSSARIGTRLVLRAYRAKPLSRRNAGELIQLFEALAQRANLTPIPQLYYIPSNVMNAFAVSQDDQAAVAVTAGLLQHLNPRELAGVLAHELSHIRHQDIHIMGLADAFSRVTRVLGQLGQLLILLSVPALLFGIELPVLGALVLLLVPGASALLQLALSRSREYHADLVAVDITGDPAGLASALRKIERVQSSWFDRVFLPGRREEHPALLRTHPHTDDRIERLRSLAEDLPTSTLRPAHFLVSDAPAPPTRPRWRWHGSWY